MNRLIEYFTKQGVFVDILTVAVIGIGIVSFFQVKREVFPNVTFDTIVVSTIYPGAAAETVEKLITNPLEQDLKELDGIKKLFSTSIDGRSSIVVQLDPDQTTEKEAKDDIDEIINRFSQPDGAEEPEAMVIESKQMPIIQVSIAGNLSDIELREIAKDLQEKLRDVKGVARVVYRGERKLEVKVEVDPRKLSRARLSLDDVVRALKQQNYAIPAGSLEASQINKGQFERVVRTSGEFENIDDVKKTVVRANEYGEMIQVGALANVFYDLEKTTVINHTNGLPALNLTILKKETADAVELVDLVKERVEEFKPTLRKDAEIHYLNDFSYFVKRRLGVLSNNLLVGLSLVLLVLSLILPFRVAMMVSLGIPFSFLGAMIIFQMFDLSINLISMMGLIIVSGMLIDDAVVVTDNCVRNMENGMPPGEAAVKGTQEVWRSVTASVFTTIIAFLPMLFMTGIMGKFIWQIPLGVIVALGVSLFEAFFVLPHHIGRWIKIDRNRFNEETNGNSVKRRNFIGSFLRLTGRIWEKRVVPSYITILKKSLRHRYFVLAGGVSLFIGSVAIASFGMKFVLFPPGGIETFMIKLEAEVGTTLLQMETILKPIEKEIEKLPKDELQDYETTVGIQQQDPNDPNTKRGSEYALLKVFLTPAQDRKRSSKDITEFLRNKLGKPPGIVKIAFSEIHGGPPVGKAVSVSVRAKEYELIIPAANELKEALKKINGVFDVEDSYTIGKEEIHLNIKPAETAAASLSVAQIGNTVRGAFEGIIATNINRLDEEIPVRVLLPKQNRSREQTLKELLIPNPRGDLIPLDRVTKRFKEQGLAFYSHLNNQREIEVFSGVDTEVITSKEVNEILKGKLPELRKKYPQVTIDFEGEIMDTKEGMASLARAFIFAVIGIILVLIITFKRLLQPLLILLTVPLGIISVVWSFLIHGLPLSFLGMLGIVALAGVIVNNAIIFIDFVNQERDRGEGRWESIFAAARARIRPIFLTTITTVCGVLPTAYGLGGSDPFVLPIAMALGWGVLFGALLTVFVFPASIAILDDVSAFLKKLFYKTAN